MTRRLKSTKNNELNIRKSHTFKIFALFSLIILFPNLNSNFVYIPPLIVGIIALYSLRKIIIIQPVKWFFCFSMFISIMNLVLSIINGEYNIVELIISSLRLFYPFIGLVVGGLIKKTSKSTSLVLVLYLLLLIQFLFGWLQIDNETFRIWSYQLYRGSSAESSLYSFQWTTGRRIIGTIGNSNSVGFFAIITTSFILVLSKALKNNLLRTFIGISSLILSMLIVINTQSRTSIILLAVVFFLVTYWNRNLKGISRIFFIAISLLISFGLYSYMGSMISRDINFFELTPRIDAWTNRVREMFNIAKYSNGFTIITGIGYSLVRKLGFIDNMYLKFFLSNGLIGLISFTALSFKLLLYSKNVSDGTYRNLTIIMAIIIISINMLAEFQEIFKVSIITFILLGYGLYSNIYE